MRKSYKNKTGEWETFWYPIRLLIFVSIINAQTLPLPLP